MKTVPLKPLKAISSPLLETAIDGAQGVLLNITGGINLSLYEVQEAADIVAAKIRSRCKYDFWINH